MATITEDEVKWVNTAMDTPFTALCVKRRTKSFQALLDMRYSHGKLVSPTIPRELVQGRDQAEASALLAAAMNALNMSVVTVRGHGWGIDGDKFVWTGTTKEFNRIWEID